jgi:hypothetical protein
VTRHNATLYPRSLPRAQAAETTFAGQIRVLWTQKRAMLATWQILVFPQAATWTWKRAHCPRAGQAPQGRRDQKRARRFILREPDPSLWRQFFTVLGGPKAISYQ